SHSRTGGPAPPRRSPPPSPSATRRVVPSRPGKNDRSPLHASARRPRGRRDQTGELRLRPASGGDGTALPDRLAWSRPRALMRTQIAYLTGDEVNHSLALRIARECGAPLVLAPLGSVLPGGTRIARLHDLDHVPPRQREELLKDLLAGPPAVPVGVHSYNLAE